MRKIIMLCVMCLCGGIAMGQVLEQGAKALMKVGAGQGVMEIAEQGIKTFGEAAEKVFVEIPLVEKSVQNAMGILGQSAYAGKNLVEATAALERLTPDQRVALNIRGVAGSFDPKFFNYSVEGLSATQIKSLKEAVLAKENEMIATRATILERQQPLMLQYAPYIRQNIAAALHPAEGESTAAWIVGQQLPKDLEFLCIAEENAFMLEGLHTMDNLLTAIRAKFPEREIVLVTSFVPNKTVFFPGNDIPTNDYHYQVWQSAARNNIPVTGVDISVKMPETGYLHPDGKEVVEVTESSTGQTALGQELQRKQFIRTLNSIQMVYHDKGIKDPLFIVYGRPVNMLYNGFASVADDLDHSFVNMKVIHLAPTTGVDAAGRSTSFTTDFERMVAPNVAFQLASPVNKTIAWGPRSDMPKVSGADIIAKQERR